MTFWTRKPYEFDTDLPCHQEHKLVISNSVFYSSQPSPSPSPVRLASSGPGGPASGPSGPASGPASGAASDGEEAVSYDSYNFDDYDIIHADESLSVTESCRNRVVYQKVLDIGGSCLCDKYEHLYSRHGIL
ncbi:hypothetical protein evm_014921, partial [Chilo suppressalis]